MTPRAEIDVYESDLRRQGPLLDILLLDRTSSRIAKKNRNIIWATDSYVTTGKRCDPFLPTKQIGPGLVTGAYSTLIQPRAAKSKDEQKRRTKDKAEVFTPLTIVDEMNSAIDRAIGENAPDDHTWQDYIRLLKLEITCGEAPYIVSRYDPTSTVGKLKPIGRRVGFLDKKLDVVNKRTNKRDPDEWFRWVIEAYKASYGYEWQGDNLLIARENLLYTFYDYWRAKFGKSDKDLPPMEWRIEIATIISWNIWQMDGLKYVKPMSRKQTRQEPVSVDKNQTVLFVAEKPKKIMLECEGCRLNDPLKHTGQKALIKDWTINGKTGKNVEFVSLLS